MKRILRNMTLVVSALALISCAASKELKAKAISQRSDIFSEASEGTPPKGSVNLTIMASIKTHLEGYHMLESGKSPHSKPVYPVVFNIDGQAVTWDMKGKKESTPKYDNDGKTSLDPEAGDGMKYRIEKEIRLSPGTHRIVFGLPGDDYFAETEVSLKEGETYSLEFKPVYKYKRFPRRIPSFLKGFKKYKVFLNGKQVS